MGIGDIVSSLEKDNPDGITISGGEPTEQWIEVLSVILRLRGRNPYYTVILFTGRTRGELEDMGILAIMSCFVDVAVMGPYDKDNPCKDALVSSSNQEIEFFSDRYTQKDIDETKETFEVHCEEDEVIISGFPDKDVIKSIKEGLYKCQPL